MGVERMISFTFVRACGLAQVSLHPRYITEKKMEIRNRKPINRF